MKTWKMESRLIIVAFIAFVMASTIELVTAQTFGVAIPCKVLKDCQDERLPENAYCDSSICVCPGADPHKIQGCSLDHKRVKSAETPPPTPPTVHQTSSTQTAPKTSNAVRPEVVTTLNPPKVNSTAETTLPPILADFRSRFASDPPNRTVSSDPTRCPTPCPTPSGFCNTTRRQCDCEEGFVMAVNNTKCLAVAFGLGSNCTEREQCEKHMRHTKCEDEQCVCEEGYHETGSDECWKNTKLGEKCNATKDCSYVFGAVCGDTLVCQCLPGNTANEKRDKCLSIANKYLDPCQEKLQCLAKMANSFCIDEKCRCENKSHFNETQSACVSYPSLGESCQKDYECDQGEELGKTRHQICEHGICACQKPFHQIGNICTDGAASLVPGLLSIVAAIFLFSRG